MGDPGECEVWRRAAKASWGRRPGWELFAVTQALRSMPDSPDASRRGPFAQLKGGLGLGSRECRPHKQGPESRGLELRTSRARESRRGQAVCSQGCRASAQSVLQQLGDPESNPREVALQWTSGWWRQCRG